MPSIYNHSLCWWKFREDTPLCMVGTSINLHWNPRIVAMLLSRSQVAFESCLYLCYWPVPKYETFRLLKGVAEAVTENQEH